MRAKRRGRKANPTTTNSEGDSQKPRGRIQTATTKRPPAQTAHWPTLLKTTTNETAILPNRQDNTSPCRRKAVKACTRFGKTTVQRPGGEVGAQANPRERVQGGRRKGATRNGCSAGEPAPPLVGGERRGETGQGQTPKVRPSHAWPPRQAAHARERLHADRASHPPLKGHWLKKPKQRTKPTSDHKAKTTTALTTTTPPKNAPPRSRIAPTGREARGHIHRVR